MKMKLYKPQRNNEEIVETVNKILLIVIGAIIGLILIGTVIGLISKKARPGKNYRNVDPSPKEIENLNKHLDSDQQIAAFTGIETLRILTLPEENEKNGDSNNGSSLVITPWFTYPEDNQEFFEELSKKRSLISGIITSYFSTKTKNQLLMISEDEIKAQILDEINSQMTLGQVQQIYFTDFLFLD